MRYDSVLLLGIAAAGLGLAPEIRAATINQDPTKTYVAFEAETNATLTSPSTVMFASASDSAASGGAALLTGGLRDDTNRATAIYTIQFANAGTYLLYDLCRSDATLAAADVFSANSFVIPPAFGAVAATNAAYNGGNASIPYAAFVEVPIFTVTAGEVVTFAIGSREIGTYIDRFAFADSTVPLWADTATAAERVIAFNGLVNSPVPEPTSLGCVTHFAQLGAYHW